MGRYMDKYRTQQFSTFLTSRIILLDIFLRSIYMTKSTQFRNDQTIVKK